MRGDTRADGALSPYTMASVMTQSRSGNSMMRWQSGEAFTMPLAHEARADRTDADELRHEGAASLDAAHECGWTGVDQSNRDSVGYSHTCWSISI